MPPTPPNNDDPNVVVPAAVRAASARASAIHQAAYNTEPTTEQIAGDEIAAQEQPASEQTPAELSAASLGSSAAQPELQASPTSEPKPVTQPGNEASWEHRYNSMKGRFDAASVEIRRITARNTELEAMVASYLSSSSATRPGAESVASLVTDQERSDYGDDFLNVVGRRAKQEVLPEVQGLLGKVAELEARLASVNTQVSGNAREVMLKDLDNLLPGWQKINTNSDFLSWLALPEPFSRINRHQLMMTAYEQNDAPRVAAFFKGFLA